MTTRIYACIHILNSYNIRSFYNKNKAFQKLLLCTNLCARVFCSAQKGSLCNAPQHITYMGLCHAQQTKFRHNCCNPDPANCRGPQKKSTLSCPVLSSLLHLPMDTCGETLPAGTPGLGGRNTVFPSTCGSGLRAPELGQWEGQDVPLVIPSSCVVKGGIPSSRRHLPT